MRVKKTEIDVVTAPSEAVGGAKIEADQRPVLTTDHVLTESAGGEALKRGELRDGGQGTVTAGVDTKHVRVESAAEAAEYLSAGQCAQCRHFDHAKGQECLEKLRRGSADERRVFNQARETISAVTILDLMGGSIFMDDRDEERLRKVVGSELMEIGLCTAHTSFLKDDLLQMPEGGCLDAGLPNLFEAVSTDVEKQLVAARDLVLQTANDSKR